jgi:hypothetical protein
MGVQRFRRRQIIKNYYDFAWERSKELDAVRINYTQCSVWVTVIFSLPLAPRVHAWVTVQKKKNGDRLYYLG